MQRNISTIWWRFGGFVMSLIGTVAWTHDAKALDCGGSNCSSLSSYLYDGKTNSEPDAVYDASGIDQLRYCDYTYDGSLYSDSDGYYPNTSSTIDGEPWWCTEKWWINASDEMVLAEINSLLGEGWNSKSGTIEWNISTTEDNLSYTEGVQYGDRILEPHHSIHYTEHAGADDDLAYVLADYGYAYTNIYRIVGCASGYTLKGASVGADVTSLSGISCVANSDGGTTVVPANCPGIPNDNNLITINERGDQGCFFWEADTSTHNLYDATGYFKYTTDCACWDDGSRICS